MIEVVRRDTSIPDYLRDWTPKTGLGFSVLKALKYVPDELAAELVERISRVTVMEASLALKTRIGGRDEDLGVVSRRLVTDTGVAFIVDAFQNITEIENFKYHGVGTGGTAEAASQSALVTESTTILNPDSTRATGSTTENAANIYRTVGTVSFDGAGAITEHAIFSQAATGGGVMLDRSLFAAINVASGDSIQATYDLTFTSGG